MGEPLFDVVAVEIATGAERLMAERKTEPNAEAFIRMAIARRGVDVEFYKAVPHPWKPAPEVAHD